MTEREPSLYDVMRIAFLDDPCPPIHPETEPERMLKAGLSEEAGAIAVAQFIKSRSIPNRM